MCKIYSNKMINMYVDLANKKYDENNDTSLTDSVDSISSLNVEISLNSKFWNTYPTSRHHVCFDLDLKN